MYWRLTHLLEITDCNQTHFCCKCWLHSLDMTLFEWCWWYLWPRMVFKMSLEFLTVSLDITILTAYSNLEYNTVTKIKLLTIITMPWWVIKAELWLRPVKAVNIIVGNIIQNTNSPLKIKNNNLKTWLIIHSDLWSLIQIFHQSHNLH